MSDQNLMRILPLTTTSGLQGDVAEDFETFRQELGPTDCIVAVNAAGECTWTSRRSSNVQDLERGLLDALGGTEGDVAMGEG